MAEGCHHLIRRRTNREPQQAGVGVRVSVAAGEPVGVAVGVVVRVPVVACSRVAFPVGVGVRAGVGGSLTRAASVVSAGSTRSQVSTQTLLTRVVPAPQE